MTSSEDRLTKELRPGEKLLWHGRPTQGVIFRRWDVFAIVFALIWNTFMVVWMLGVRELAMRFFGIPFLIIGLYLLVGRYFLDAFRRSRSVYGVTTERVLIIAFPMIVRSLSVFSLADILLDEKHGNIEFGLYSFGQDRIPWVRSTSPESNASGGWVDVIQAPCFERISNAPQVHALIAKLRDGLYEWPDA